VSGARQFLDQVGDEATLDAFVAAWQAGSLPKAAWTHAAHVAVCAWHAWPATPPAALVDQMRAGIRAFNEAVGTPNTATSGYHETLTRFWCERVQAHLTQSPAASRLAAVRSAVAHLGDARGLHREFYDIDVVADPAARATWVAPRR